MNIPIMFNNIDITKYIRLYSANVEILYRKTDSELLTKEILLTPNVGQSPMIDENGNVIPNKFITTYDYPDIGVSGKNNSLVSGVLFNENASVIQNNVTSVNNDKTYNYGLAFDEIVYQSFTAIDPIITSVEFLTNGYVGNPDKNLELSILEDNNKTPGKIIKKINVNGWGKSDDKVKYNIFIDNLIVGKNYWIKLEIVNKQRNNYYYIKYDNNYNIIGKMLYQKDGNLKNMNDGKSCFAFTVNSMGVKRYFNNIPYNGNFANPYLSIKLNSKNYSDNVLSKLKVNIRDLVK
jgi:hypothetical protein